MTTRPSPEDFEPYVGVAFDIEGAPVQLTLSRIERSSGEASASFISPFLLIFEGPEDDVLSEGFHAFTVGDSRFELYAMPIHSRSPDRQSYQVAFS